MNRTENIKVRLTPEERECLKEASRLFFQEQPKSRENFSEYVREKLLMESGFRNKKLEQLLLANRYELRKIGTNINQVTKKINSGFGTRRDLAILQKELDEIQGQMEALEEEIIKLWQSQS